MLWTGAKAGITEHRQAGTMGRLYGARVGATGKHNGVWADDGHTAKKQEQE